MSKNRENKKFGEIAPVTRNRVGFSSILKIFSAAFCVVISLFLIAAVLKKGIERVPPTIQFTQPLNSIGPATRDIAFTVADEGAGIKSVALMVRSGNAKEYLKQVELAREKTYATSFAIDSKQITIPDGPAEVVLEAEDDSVWHSRSVMIIPVIIDREAPALELLYVSPKVASLGTGLAVYRSSDRNLKEHGIRVGSDFFAGQPAGNLHPDMGLPGVFATFFAATERANVKVRAIDVAGNETERIPTLQIVPRREGRRIALGLGNPENFQQLKGLFEHEADPERKVAGSFNKDVIAGLAKGMDMGPQVLMGLADIRVNRVVQEIAQIIHREPEPIRRWEGLPRLIQMRVKYDFNDILAYEVPKGVLWEGKLNGGCF
jgi:hypothetical protein